MSSSILTENKRICCDKESKMLVSPYIEQIHNKFKRTFISKLDMIFEMR